MMTSAESGRRAPGKAVENNIRN